MTLASEPCDSVFGESLDHESSRRTEYLGDCRDLATDVEVGHGPWRTVVICNHFHGAKTHMSFSDNLKGHRPTLSSPFIEPYQKARAEIIKLVNLDSANSGRVFIAELEIISSAKTAEIDPVTNKKVEVNAAGTKPAWRQKLTGTKNDPGAGSVLSFFMALFGQDEDWVCSDAGFKAMDEATSDAQPCEGWLIDFETWDKATKAKKEPFTRISWTHVVRTEEFLKALAAAKAERLKAFKIASR